MLDLESAIRNRAYHIWLGEGAAEGRDLDHWLRAEAEITAALAPPAAPAKPRRTTAAKRTTKTKA